MSPSQYEKYSITSVAEVSATGSADSTPAKAVSPKKGKVDKAGKKPAKESAKAKVSPAAEAKGAKVVAVEEKKEFRDQDGNILDEEQVKELEGKVEFQTKYETHTRVVDENGNELEMPEGGWPEDVAAGIPPPAGGVAPPHPDVEGVDKETVKRGEGAAGKDAAASRDGEKEAERAKAKPASEGKDATRGHEEL